MRARLVLPAAFRPDAKALAAPFVSGTLFFGSAWIGLALSRDTDGLAALWPANAILLSALLLTARSTHGRHLAAAAIAGLLANLIAGMGIALSGIFGVANVVAAGMAFRLVGERPTACRMFEDPAFILRFVRAVACGAVAGATIGAAALWWTTGSFFAPWLSWMTSDLLGLLLVTPLSVSVLGRVRDMERDERDRRAALRWQIWPLACVMIASILVFYQSRYPLLFIPLAAVMIATYRLGLLGAVAGTLLVALVGSAMMATGRGPTMLVAGSIVLRIQFFQFYLATLYATSMPLATLLSERARLARERAESDRRHRRILDRSRETVFETDLSGRWTYLNPAWQIATGRSVDDSIGQSVFDILLDTDRARAEELLAPLYRQERQRCQLDVRYVHADGGTRWASIRSHLLVDDQQVVIGTYGTIHDVTVRMENERLYRLLADNSNDMIVNFDANGVRRYVSPASLALIGFTPEELTGQPAAGAIHPDDRMTVVATCRTLLDGAENPICIYRQRHKDGRYVWLEASYRLLRDEVTGVPDGFIASVRDIGRRTQAELERTEAAAKLEEANRLLLMAEEMSAVGHWRFDVASGTVYWSDSVCRIHGRPDGYSPALETAIDAYHPEDRAKIEAVVEAALTEGRSYALSARIIQPGGAVRHVVLNGRAERGPDGSVTGMFGVFQDVTHTQEAQRALIEASERVASSNRMLTMAQAVGNLGHWRIDEVRQTLFWSEETYRIFGVSPSTAPNLRDAYAYYHPDDVGQVKAAVAAAFASRDGYMSRARIIQPGGAERHILTRGEVEFDGNGEPIGLFGIVQDVTEQVMAEAQRRAEAEKYVLITEQASDMICLTDVEGVVRFVSPSARVVLGYEPEMLVGSLVRDHVETADLALIDAHRDELTRRPAGEVVPLRIRLKRQDGTPVWIDIAARVASDGADPRIISVCRDVTAQVAVEEQLRVAQVHAEAAARAKTDFLAHMSHEIRTPMNGVIGFADLLLAGGLTTDQRRQVELIADSGRAMMRLLNDILDLSKVDAGQMQIAQEPVDLREMLGGCVALVTPAAAHKHIAIDCDIAADLPATVIGDGLRLRQVVLNLLGNAVKFTEQGSVTLRASATGPNDPRLVIEVRDTGIGIAPDRLDAVFERFVQAEAGTAARYGGTGLGLPISARLARLMGGALTLESAPGEGTRFFLTLPLLCGGVPEDAPETGPRAPRSTGTIASGLRVLVAEDHDVNQLLMRSMLERIGCSVDIAFDGRAAVEAVAQAAGDRRPYALVLMDMQMPELNGIEATRRIRKAGFAPADLPIVALTANAYADDVAACLDAGMQAHLAKPLRLDALEATLRRWAIVAAPAAPVEEIRFSAGIAARYHRRKAELLTLIEELAQADTIAPDRWQAAIDHHHKLAGTGALFGDDALGAQAKLFETQATSWPTDERASRLSAHLARMRAVDDRADPATAAA